MVKHHGCVASPFSAGIEKTQSLRFCLALGDTWLKDPKIEVRIHRHRLFDKGNLQLFVNVCMTV